MRQAFQLDDHLVRGDGDRSPHVRRSEGSRCREPFIPPLNERWAAAAHRVGGSALAVGLLLWKCARMRRSARVSVPTAWLESWGISRWAYNSALSGLEEAGLVRLTPRPGAKSLVVILPADPPECNGPGGADD